MLRDVLTRAESRTRWLASTFALCTFAALPTPVPGATLPFNLCLSGLWFATGALAWAAWYRPAQVLILWCIAFVLALVAWHYGAGLLPAALLGFWLAWLRLRRGREVSKLSSFAALVLIGSLAVAKEPVKPLPAKPKPAPAPAHAKVDAARLLPTIVDAEDRVPVATPRYLAGYTLNDLASCSLVDVIPWKFRPDRRKTRLLLRDHLRLNTDSEFAKWEIHQVMDHQGYITYIFSKVKDGKRVESIVVKDNVYNRIVDKNGRSKVVEVQDLRTLINRPVVVFTHTDTSTVSFAPGLAGQSVLSVELRQATGRPLPPLYIRGSFCERAEGNTNSIDLLGNKGEAATNGTTN